MKIKVTFASTHKQIVKRHHLDLKPLTLRKLFQLYKRVQRMQNYAKFVSKKATPFSLKASPLNYIYG